MCCSVEQTQFGGLFLPPSTNMSVLALGCEKFDGCCLYPATSSQPTECLRYKRVVPYTYTCSWLLWVNTWSQSICHWLTKNGTKFTKNLQCANVLFKGTWSNSVDHQSIYVITCAGILCAGHPIFFTQTHASTGANKSVLYHLSFLTDVKLGKL